MSTKNTSTTSTSTQLQPPAPLPAPSLSLASSSAASSSASSSTTPITIENGKRIKKNGFIYVSVKGKPEERGYAQGFLIAERIVQFIRTYAFFVWTEHGRDITFFSKMIKDLFGKIVQSPEYKEYYLEMEGIARGVVGKISSFTTQQEKDAYFSVGAIEGTKIVLPPDSYLEHRNLVYNNASQEQKSKYNKDGKKLIEVGD